jgi:hypothetical protein
MADIDLPSSKQVLWETMRQDFVALAPEHASSGLLPCCICGRLLPQEHFSIEHILPQQALMEDPPEIKSDPLLTMNRRTRLTLLCKRPLKLKSDIVSPNGCNGWKGRYFDGFLRDIVANAPLRKRGGQFSSQHTVAFAIAAYLAMVSEFGYRVVYIESGHLMRRQFFHPHKFLQGYPDSCQMMIAGERYSYPSAPSSAWATPFTFLFKAGRCIVTMRQTVAFVPLSRDPTWPVASALRIVPSKYLLRPDFRTMFS